MDHPCADKVRAAIREVPDFPTPGVNFYDITTVLKDADLFRSVIDALAERYEKREIDVIAGIEARGFIFAAALAYHLGIAFVPVRKPGKLPAAVERVEYKLEYGTDCLEIHVDALEKGANVLIVDDLIATGGTAKGTLALVNKLGANPLECVFVIELLGLAGRALLEPTPVVSLVKYD